MCTNPDCNQFVSADVKLYRDMGLDGKYYIRKELSRKSVVDESVGGAML